MVTTQENQKGKFSYDETVRLLKEGDFKKIKELYNQDKLDVFSYKEIEGSFLKSKYPCKITPLVELAIYASSQKDSKKYEKIIKFFLRKTGNKIAFSVKNRKAYNKFDEYEYTHYCFSALAYSKLVSKTISQAIFSSLYEHETEKRLTRIKEILWDARDSDVKANELSNPDRKIHLKDLRQLKPETMDFVLHTISYDADNYADSIQGPIRNHEMDWYKHLKKDVLQQRKKCGGR